MKAELLVVMVPSVLSIAGGVFTLLSFGLFPRTRSSAQVLAVFLSFSGMCYGGLTFFHSAIDHNSLLCSLTAMLATYFNNTALFTTVVVANYMRLIFFGMTGQGSSNISLNLSLGNYLFIWGLPAVLAALPFITRHYGHNENDVFCWIKDKSSDDDSEKDLVSLFWQLIIVAIPAVLGVCYNFWVYIRILRNIRAWGETGDVTRGDRDAVMAVINRIRWYPIILAVVYIMPLVHRIHQASTGENTTLMSALGAGSLKMQGFLDSITYGLSPSIISHWKNLLKSCNINCCGKPQRGWRDTGHSDDKPILNFQIESSFKSEASEVEINSGTI